MSYKKVISRLEGGAVLAECGPMRLVISSFVGKVAQREMGEEAAEKAFGYLERVAHLRNILTGRFSNLPDDLKDPLGLEMIRSVLAIGDDDLTPMAAVAGTVADAVADFLFERGMTKVVVDNGGDVAVRLQSGESASVGIRPDINEQDISDVIILDSSSPSWGITTSGLGGRSLTRGVAAAATVFARSASLADAAATTIANASYVEDEQVIQRPAEAVDPDTDIPGLAVTVEVGPLSEEKKSMALSGAMKRAEDLSRKGIIFGAYVAVQGRIAMTDFCRERLKRRCRQWRSESL